MMFLVVGDANADLIARTACFPREGDDSPLLGLGWTSGGSAANVATGIARLGGRARLMACVGNDPAASVALEAARRAGVELQAVQRDATAATGICFVAVSPSGERTLFSFRGANVGLTRGDAEASLADVGWVHIAGHALLEGRQRETVLALIEEAARRGVPMSLDLCLPLLRAAKDTTLVLAPRMRVVFANALELEALGGAGALALLHAHGTAIPVAKLGARGARIGGAAEHDVMPFAVEARDTTGAGDAFVAGFLLAITRGAAPEVAARLGNAIGAMAVSREDAAESLPSKEQAQAFLEERGATRERALLEGPATVC